MKKRYDSLYTSLISLALVRPVRSSRRVRERRPMFLEISMTPLMDQLFINLASQARRWRIAGLDSEEGGN